jgi:hypothetical protein
MGPPRRSDAATTTSVTVGRAEHPFQFVAASYLVQICRERAATLAELAAGLKTVSDASIFYHTFQSLEEHHYTAYSSEFAQWVLAACNEYSLAERLATLDVADFVSIDALRAALIRTIDEHLASHPGLEQRVAFEPFFFCEAVEFTVPLEIRATTLLELADGISKLGLQSLHYHFISSRLRLHLKTNDFSYWIDMELGNPALAARLNRIDFHTQTLNGLRDELVATIRRWAAREEGAGAPGR